MVLTGSDTYSGNTTIRAGTLQLAGWNDRHHCWGCGRCRDLAFDRSDTLTFGGVISGAGNWCRWAVAR